MKIIGYTFDADAHCVACAQKHQFKYDPASLNAPDVTQNDEHGVPVHAVDSEGNLIHPIFETDEQIFPLYCGDCHAVISAVFRPGKPAAKLT
jgi:formate-dependent nitrite reductase cytochrome c552 subunit